MAIWVGEIGRKVSFSIHSEIPSQETEYLADDEVQKQQDNSLASN